jgi:hypothetical protein
MSVGSERRTPEFNFYMGSLFLENFDLCLSNQYILVRVIPSFYFCKNVFVPGKSPAKVPPEMLDIFLEELYVVYMVWGGMFHFNF